jgi:hypothetical protein
MNLAYAAGLALLFAAAPAVAAGDGMESHFREPGQMDEYQAGVPRLPGDKWGVAVLTIDEKGDPQRCYLRDTNIRSKELRWSICNAFKREWYTKPLMKDGVPVRGIVERMVVMPGRASQAAARKARKAAKEQPPATP